MDSESISLHDFNSEDLGSCQDVCVNVGIVGRAGVGKSQFIQAIIADGVSCGEPETTEGRSTAYIYPTLPNVYIWELPSVENPGDQYLKCTRVDRYDFFVILSDTEFSETEFWLAEQLDKRKKGFFFVRTKTDKRRDTNNAISRNRHKIYPTYPKYPTFAISNRRISGFDFPKLKTNLHCAVISLKRFSVLGSDAEGLKKYLESKLDEWKDIKINVGIVGETGSGKSSFINAIRGLHPADKEAAKVGVTETTSKAIWYPHPDNENLKFWDLPGVGSSNFPRKNYLKDIDVDTYDFFLIVSARRITDDDKWLAMELSLKEKSYFFLRTKFDQAVKGDIRKKDEFREQIIRNIKSKADVPDCRIYVVSNVYTDRFDFPRLREDLILALPSLKRESLALTLCGYSENLIQMKKNTLKPRLWKATVMSGGAGALPVPGIDVAVDLGIFLHEAKFYRKVFGLNAEPLSRLAKESGVNIDRFKKAMSKTGALSLTKVSIKSAIIGGRVGLAFATRTGLTSVLEVVVPVVGSVISGGISFALTYGFLRKMLDDFASDAASICKLLAEKIIADKLEIQA